MAIAVVARAWNTLFVLFLFLFLFLLLFCLFVALVRAVFGPLSKLHRARDCFCFCFLAFVTLIRLVQISLAAFLANWIRRKIRLRSSHARKQFTWR